MAKWIALASSKVQYQIIIQAFKFHMDSIKGISLTYGSGMGKKYRPNLARQ